MTTAFIFPGQGSQSVGMGRGLYEAYPAARAVFQEVDDALGEPLSDVIFEGPEETLRLTANAQPALLAVSLAVLRAVETQGIDMGDAVLVAGHSLGEYSALAAADALTVSDAARLLRLRGNAMQAAVAPGEGAMAALLGLDLATAEEVARLAGDSGVGICEVANDNAPGQVVVSGTRQAVDRAVEIARQKGARRPTILPVSAPFHSSLMGPAAEVMREAFDAVRIRAPRVPLLANVSALAIQSPEAIRKSLVAQVTGRVRWREGVLAMAATGVGTLYELGAGRVLCGLARRIDKSLEATPVNTPEDVAELAAKKAA